MSELQRLERYLKEQYQPAESNGEYVIPLDNGEQDNFTLYAEGTEEQPYVTYHHRVELNGEVFKLTSEQFCTFISTYRLGNSDNRDRFQLLYNGRQAQPMVKYSVGANQFFSHVARELGWPPHRRSSTSESVLFDEIDRLTSHGDSVRIVSDIDDIQSAEIGKAIRHSIRVPKGEGGFASGTIVLLSSGDLAIATAAHNLPTPSPRSLRFDPPPERIANPYRIIINGESFETSPRYSESWNYFGREDDLALLVLTHTDSMRLKRMGYSGIPLTKHSDFPLAGTRVFALGRPREFSERLILTSGVFIGVNSENAAEIVTTLYSNGGASGGGLFWFNPRTHRLEIIGTLYAVPEKKSWENLPTVSARDGNLTGGWLTHFARMDESRSLPINKRY